MNEEELTPGSGGEEDLPPEIRDILNELEGQGGDETADSAPQDAPEADSGQEQPDAGDLAALFGGEPEPYDLQSLSGAEEAEGPDNRIDMLMDVNLNVRIELGRSRLSIQEILQLCNGSVITLDKLAGDPLNIYVNNRLVAKGEVLVLNENFCIRITEIVEPVRRLEG